MNEIRLIQIVELGIILFPLFYGIEWIVKLIIKRKNPNDYISFNKEIRFYSCNKRYLEFRKYYSWIKYI